MIVFVGAAGLVIMAASDGGSIEITSYLHLPFLLPCGLVILLLRTWAYASAVQVTSSQGPHEVLLVSTNELASLLFALGFCSGSPTSPPLWSEQFG